MPPRSEIRRGPQRLSRSPSEYTSPINDPTLWPDEGSETDPDYEPSETETESESESDEYEETDSSDDDDDTDLSDSE